MTRPPLRKTRVVAECRHAFALLHAQLMRRFLLPFSIIVFSIASLCAEEAKKHPLEFDQFILVLLVRPAHAPELPKEELDKLQEGHISNMKALHAEGKLFKAGPVEDFSGRNVRGILVLATDSQEKAREWIAGDPLIKAGRLVPEFLKWYVEKGSLK